MWGFVGYGTHIVQNNIYYRGSETATWIHGDHTIKIGGDFSHLMVGYDQGSSQNGIINFSGNYSGDSFGDYLLGLPGDLIVWSSVKYDREESPGTDGIATRPRATES